MKKNILLRYRISLVVAAVLLSAQIEAADTPNEKELSSAIISAIKEDLKPSMLSVLSASELTSEKEFAANFKKVMDDLGVFRKKYPQLTGEGSIDAAPGAPVVVAPAVVPVVTPLVPSKPVTVAPVVSTTPLAAPKPVTPEVKKIEPVKELAAPAKVILPEVKKTEPAKEPVKEPVKTPAPVATPSPLEPVVTPDLGLETEDEDLDLNLPAIANLPGLGVLPTIPAAQPTKTAENDETIDEAVAPFDEEVAISLAMNQILSFDEEYDEQESQDDEDGSTVMLADASEEVADEEEFALAQNEEDAMDDDVASQDEEGTVEVEDLMLAQNEDPESLDEEFASLDEEMIETEEPLLTLAQNDVTEEDFDEETQS